MATVKVLNLDAGVLCVDVPQEVPETDAVEVLLAKVDPSVKLDADGAARLLLGLELAKRAESRAHQSLLDAAARRAKSTVDLYPAHQGEGKPRLVNEVDEATWRKIEKMPPVAARIAAGRLKVTGGADRRGRRTPA